MPTSAARSHRSSCGLSDATGGHGGGGGGGFGAPRAPWGGGGGGAAPPPPPPTTTTSSSSSQRALPSPPPPAPPGSVSTSPARQARQCRAVPGRRRSGHHAQPPETHRSPHSPLPVACFAYGCNERGAGRGGARCDALNAPTQNGSRCQVCRLLSGHLAARARAAVQLSGLSAWLARSPISFTQTALRAPTGRHRHADQPRQA
jgi:hypothetical protein